LKRAKRHATTQIRTLESCAVVSLEISAAELLENFEEMLDLG